MKKVFIVTGISGSGKSQALKCFEDFGFYCIDNIPVKLFSYLEDLIESENYLNNVAIGIDIREIKYSRDFISVIKGLKSDNKKVDFKIIFLDANDNVILQRFSETRHKHPLGENIQIAVKKERKILAPLKEIADKIIDTTKLTLGELKEIISSLIITRSIHDFKINIISFGYKYGIPMDADIIVDVRFLPNPFYVKRLRDKTGLDKKVRQFIEENPIFKKFTDGYISHLKELIPLYMKEGKSFLTIGFGCTGGRHRSVCVSNFFYEILKKEGYDVSVFHRDIRKI